MPVLPGGKPLQAHRTIQTPLGKASAGYYSAELDNQKILAEATTTERCGLLRFAFGPGSDGRVIYVKISAANTPSTAAKASMLDSVTLVGENTSGSFCVGIKHTVYFALRLNRKPDSVIYWRGDTPIGDTASIDGTDVGVAFVFNSSTQADTLQTTVGISYVAPQYALDNLAREVGMRSFNQVLEESRQAWHNAIAPLSVKGGSEAQRRMLYSALYKIFRHPHIFSEYDGSYRSFLSPEVRTDTVPRYTTYSLWDTYRTVHPLMCLIAPQQQFEMVDNMLSMFNEGGWFPQWELNAKETYVMSGDPASMMVADSYAKGIPVRDTALLGRALGSMADADENPIRRGNKLYKENGYVHSSFPQGTGSDGSASSTLEFSLADWCAATAFDLLNNPQEASRLRRRSNSFASVWDPNHRFFNGRHADGTFVRDFDPDRMYFDYTALSEHSHLFTEGNGWHYRFFTPHAVDSLATLFGSHRALRSALDTLFDSDRFYYLGPPYINEPTIGFPYLYSRLDSSAYRTQEVVADIIQHFKDSPYTMFGGEDCGTLSAWYVFNAIGMYPHAPADPRYTLCTPVFDTVHIGVNFHRGDMRPFTITAEGTGPYTARRYLNGIPYEKWYLPHDSVRAGAHLHVVRSAVPRTDFPTVPRSSQELRVTLPVEYLVRGEWQSIEYAETYEVAVFAEEYSRKAILQYTTPDTTISIERYRLLTLPSPWLAVRAVNSTAESEWVVRKIPTLSTQAVARVMTPQFKAYPNPANNVLVVELYTATPLAVQSKILSITGQVVAEHLWQAAPGQQKYMLPLNELAPGYYTLSIGEMPPQAFLIQR